MLEGGRMLGIEQCQSYSVEEIIYNMDMQRLATTIDHVIDCMSSSIISTTRSEKVLISSYDIKIYIGRLL